MSCHLSFTPFITANNADITVGGNTNLKGSLIAAGYYDENGYFIDNGNLNLITNTLTFSNLNSTTYSTNTSIGGGASLNQNKQGETLPNASSVTYDASSGISYSKEKTLATIGSGNLIVRNDTVIPAEAGIQNTTTSDDITKLNRNTDNLTKELLHGGVSSDVSATIDMRMFTEDGRKDIKHDMEDATTLYDAIYQIATSDRADITDFFEENGKQYNVLQGVREVIASNPELQQQLSNEDLDPETKQAMLQTVINNVMTTLGYTPDDVKLLYTDQTGKNSQTIKGYNNDGTTYINDKNIDDTTELISTTGHESQHGMDAQDKLSADETYADNFGDSLARYYMYALDDYGQTLAQSNSHNGAYTSELLQYNNYGFAIVDKESGENSPGDPRLNVAYGDPMEWSKLWKNTATVSGGVAAWLEAKYYSTRIPYFKTGAKAAGIFGAFSLYNAYAFEEQATGKWDKTGIATDIITSTTKISNNPFTEFVYDEAIGNSVDSVRGN